MNGKTFLITGGTGFLGTLLSSLLLKEGDNVIYLSRSKNGTNAKTRIEQNLKALNCFPKEIKVIEADLGKKMLGLDEQTVSELENRVDGIWHMAANLSFKEKDRKEVFETNVEGLKNLLELASRIKSPFFHVSTAYVHGQRPGKVSESDLIKPPGFNNPYEESKFTAEGFVKKWGASNGGKFIIFRPSILIEGNSNAENPFGYYKLVETLYRLKKMIGNRKIFLPFPCCKSTLNLMPVETAADWMLKISKNPASMGQTFHIVNPSPFPISSVVQQTFEALGLKAVPFPAPRFMAYFYFFVLNLLGKIIKPLRGLAKFNYYKYYIIENNIYGMENTNRLLGREQKMAFPPDYIHTIASNFVIKLKEREGLHN